MRSICGDAGVPKASVTTLKGWKIIPKMWRRLSELRNRKTLVYRCSCIYTLDHQSEIDGLICESFAYDLPVPGFVLSILKGFDHIAPHLHVYTLKNENFSRDPLFVGSMNNDPLIKGESEPTQTDRKG